MPHGLDHFHLCKKTFHILKTSIQPFPCKDSCPPARQSEAQLEKGIST